MSGSSPPKTLQQTHNPSHCNNPERYHLKKTCCEIFKTHDIIIYLTVTNIMQQTTVSAGYEALLVEMTVAQIKISLLIAVKNES
jgi:hypothetical protein